MLDNDVIFAVPDQRSESPVPALVRYVHTFGRHPGSSLRSNTLSRGYPLGKKIGHMKGGARTLGRHPSVILLEIKINSTEDNRYQAFWAQNRTNDRRKKSRQRQRINDEEIRTYLKEKFEPVRATTTEYVSPITLSPSVLNSPWDYRTFLSEVITSHCRQSSFSSLPPPANAIVPAITTMTNINKIVFITPLFNVSRPVKNFFEILLIYFDGFYRFQRTGRKISRLFSS